MPQIKSAKKRVQVAERNRRRNMAYKSAIRTAMKQVREAKKPEEAKEALKKVYSLIDRAVVKGVLHKNTGARYKSRLTSSIEKSA